MPCGLQLRQHAVQQLKLARRPDDVLVDVVRAVKKQVRVVAHLPHLVIHDNSRQDPCECENNITALCIFSQFPFADVSGLENTTVHGNATGNAIKEIVAPA